MTARGTWRNAYYKATIVYIAVLVTTILGLQFYRFFIAAPSSEILCPKKTSALSYLPVIGVLFDG